jgi:adenylate cyclase
VQHRPSGPGTEVLEDEAVLAQLDRILASEDFDASPRSRDFVRFIVEEALAGRGESLTQAAIATRVFGRREDFDPTVDPIVRIQAGRLRRSLERYYLLSGGGDAVRIELPRGTYLPVLRTGREPGSSSPEPRPSARLVSAFGWPSVVVEAFEPLGSEAGLGDAVRRVTEHLCVELGHYGDVEVVRRRELDALGRSPCDGGDFVLSGRLSSDLDGPRLSARLVHCASASQIWAEEYRGTPGASTSFFEETARVVAARVASEQGVIAQRLWAEQRSRSEGEADTPYGALLRSYRFFFNRDVADFEPALGALQRTVREQPECGLAWAQLARLYSANYAFELADVDTPIDEAVAFAQRAVQLDPFNQRARVVLAGAFLIKGELGAGLAETEKAREINPDSFTYLEWIGWLTMLLGEWERGAEITRGVMARNPHHIPVALHALWADHLRRGELEAAYQAALRISDGLFFWRALMRTSCLGLLGRDADARESAAGLVRSKPAFERRARTLIGRYIKFPELVEQIVEGLRASGLAID